MPTITPAPPTRRRATAPALHTSCVAIRRKAERGCHQSLNTVLTLLPAPDSALIQPEGRERNSLNRSILSNVPLFRDHPRRPFIKAVPTHNEFCLFTKH